MKENTKKVVKETTAKVETQKPAINTPKKPVLKSRMYYLKPPNEDVKWLQLQAEDRGKGKRLVYFDEETGRSKAIRYAANSYSPFVDEQDQSGNSLIREQIIFEFGMLGTTERDVNLQNFLDKHPWNVKNGGGFFYEHNPEAEAEDEVDMIQLENEAVSKALGLDIDMQEAILRPVYGQGIYTISSKEVKRELLLYAKGNPVEFLEAVDSNLLFNISTAYKALDLKIIELVDGNRTLRWSKTKDHLLTIPYGKDQHAFIAEWFTSDEGLLVLDAITKLI